MRSKVLSVLIIIVIAASAHADTFTKNQVVVAGAAPLTITRDLATTSTPVNGTIPVGAAIHVVYQVNVPVGDPSPVTLAVTTPPAYVAVLTRCAMFLNGSLTGTTPLSCTAIGPLSNPNDQVIVTVDGYLKQAGSATANFNVTRGSISEPTSVNMVAGITTLNADLDVTKLVKPKLSGAFGSAATVAFGDTVTYKVIVKNASAVDPTNHTTDLYLGPLLALRDTLSTPSTNDVTITFAPSAFVCTPTGSAVCPTMSGAVTTSLGASTSQSLATFTYPTSSSGFLPAGESFEITFDAKLTTSALCSPGQNNKILNTAGITYSNNTNTISDTIATNNSSSVTVSLTGLPVTGCSTGSGGSTPAPPITKTLGSPPAWGLPMKYRITVTNNTTQTISGITMKDWVWGNGTPPFTATFLASSVVCSPTCINPQPVNFAPWVTGTTKLYDVNFAPLAPNATQTVDYEVRYDTPCSLTGKGGTITNGAYLYGGATGNSSVDAAMPDLPKCDLAVRKTRTSGPTTFSSFPVTLGYKVLFINNSPTQTVKVGTLADAMAYDNFAYANKIDVDYSYTCTVTNVTMATSWPTSNTINGAQIQFNNPITQGVKIFDALGGATFGPSGTLSCDVTVTLKQPPGDDSKCPSKVTANDVNVGFMDLYPNQYGNPTYQAPVTTPLPKCVSILVGKIASDATPGSTATFTLTVTNTGNDPVPNVVLTDSVPGVFTNVTWTCASGCATSSGSGNGISIPLNPIPPGAIVSVIVTTTAPAVLGSYCNTDKATFSPFPADTFFEGDQAALTTASACVQVKNPTATGKPRLSKAFDTSKIGSSGTAVLTFTITNATGDPAQSGIAFSDTLPLGLVFDTVLINTCGGMASISTDQKTFTFSGGQLAAGTHLCKIVVKVRAIGTCGVFKNDKSNFSDVSNLDVGEASAQLEIAGCAGGLIIKKDIKGAPEGYTGQFTFLVQCATPKGPYQKEVTVNWPTPGFISLSDVPAGSQCIVVEGALPGSLPTGYNWDGLPSYSPDGGVVVTTDHGGQVTVLNKLKACNEIGQVKITKIVDGVPADFAGTFKGTLQCWVGNKLVTYPVTLTAPNGLTTTIGNIPLGASCTFQETSQAPLPAGQQWNPPVYSPKYGTVLLSGLCCQNVTVTNTARPCCEQPKELYAHPKE